MDNTYDKNDTMRLLKYQTAISGEAMRAIHDIARARPFSFALASGYDIFVLGVIYGKREERKKRHKITHK